VAGALAVKDKALNAPLRAILASHALIHAAEGELFRGAIGSALEAGGIEVKHPRASEVRERAAAALGLDPDELDGWLAKVGRTAGRPWAKDHKEACLAALIAL
jgi:hypothetical protein